MPSVHSGEEDTEFKTELLDDTDSEPKEVGAKTSQSGKVAAKKKLWEWYIYGDVHAT